MIKQLRVNNLVLVESSTLTFDPHFNAITGETGAGKTALIEGIALALGARAESALIRKGSTTAFVEATFDSTATPSLIALLEESGLLSEPNEPLIIRREISKEGKNRAFVNCRSVPLPLLQKIGAELIDLIDQNAHHALRKTESQRTLLDLFGDLQLELSAFQTAFHLEKEVQSKLQTLHQLSSSKEREEATLRRQIDEIEAVNLKPGEEEALFEKYQLLANSQEISTKVEGMLTTLSDGPGAILAHLNRVQKTCESLNGFDKSFENPTALLRDAALSVSECAHHFRSYRGKLESDPAAYQLLENKLQEISLLKRKYGQTFEELDAFYQQAKERIAQLENLAFDLETLAEELKKAEERTKVAAEKLTSKRKQVAKDFSKQLTGHLHALNMPHAEVLIEVATQPRSQSGDDQIQFWLKANAGEHPALVKEHSSGGEVSRLLFAIKIALAEKNNTPTLIFDEIDANVGGRTAAIIGEKLQELGKYRQVICITHFHQVATAADTHFAVEKVEEEGRTFTRIRQLDKREKEIELLRMLGKKTETV